MKCKKCDGKCYKYGDYDTIYKCRNCKILYSE